MPAAIQKGVRVRQILPKPFEGHVAKFGQDEGDGTLLYVVREPIYEDDGVTPKMVEDQHFDLVQERDKSGALVFETVKTTDAAGNVAESQVPVWTEERINERTETVPAYHEAVFREGEIEVVPEEE